MLKQDKYEVNDIILLYKYKYCIIKKYKEYMVVLSNFEPLEIIVGYIKNDKFVKETNKKIVEQILTKN